MLVAVEASIEVVHQDSVGRAISIMVNYAAESSWLELFNPINKVGNWIVEDYAAESWQFGV